MRGLPVSLVAVHRTVSGFARIDRLRAQIEDAMAQTRAEHEQTGKAARVFTKFAYETTTGTWSRALRVVA